MSSDPLSTAATPVPFYHPHRQAWPDHFAWTDDGTEIVGRTAVGRATAAALGMNRPAMIRVRRLWVALAEHPPA